MARDLSWHLWWPALLLVGGMVLGGCGDEGDTIVSTVDTRSQIHVLGRASLSVQPDIARAELGVQTYAQQLEDAVNANNARMSEVMGALTSRGVAEDDIRTAYLSVTPQRDYGRDSASPDIVGYWVNNTLTVTLRDLDSVGGTLQAALAAGANSLNSLVFTLDDFASAQAQARQAAVADAAAKAAALASAAGSRLGEVLRIDEASSGGALYYRGAVDEAASGSSEVPVAPGTLKVTVEVEVVYALEDGD